MQSLWSKSRIGANIRPRSELTNELSFGSRMMCLAGVFVLLTLSVLAQETRGTLVGCTSDPSVAVIPQAEIVIENLNTGLKLETTSSVDGGFVATNIEPGVYQISITAQGFKTKLFRNAVAVPNPIVQVRLRSIGAPRLTGGDDE